MTSFWVLKSVEVPNSSEKKPSPALRSISQDTLLLQPCFIVQSNTAVLAGKTELWKECESGPLNEEQSFSTGWELDYSIFCGVLK